MKIKTKIGPGVAVALMLSAATLWAKTSPPQPKVSVVMMSDLHFDPYSDPAKYVRLRAADVSQWAEILSEPPSDTRAADFAALQKTCRARGVDSSWGVLKGSLTAARGQQPAPSFVTVSGDLLAHKFDCSMKTLEPSMNEEDLSNFAQKTIAFVALQLRETFPGVPVYLALGNNDSGCGDYRQAAGSRFMDGSELSIVADVFNQYHHAKVLPEFDEQMDYSAVLPKPLKSGRLIVLQDVVQAVEFKNCKGESSEDPATAQIKWLRSQLVVAREHHEHVWVMAHIPPGVDAYASFHQVATADKLCDVTTPTLMLKSDELLNTLTEFSDVVQLAVFAHTHMDEIKLLRNAAGRMVAAKLVPSVSPVNGNRPAFIVAEVEPKSAMLVDYSVYSANNVEATAFSREYIYSSAYKMDNYSAKSVAILTSRLSEDRIGSDEASLTYQKWFLPGDAGAYAEGLRKIWPSYGCGTVQADAATFRQCMCPAAKILAEVPK